ncbi:glucose-methanol-choline oxidoreductase [Mycobacterium sp. CBMA 234]|uniref:mycofactocin dehydrogenase MftG n=1 Tax=Mycolicibacterium sp. CBMA 234 TaxID=1918495 RepID=UPI0012DC3831|nr:mycofactocin system GMC family oxidoreductase MftG [Mycolicibacterium sp. CBMA 234]MUL63974.1 glucose-methanol-choline oxidoreductase [Mycolicibacterium sp. CBMA 234]
MHCDALIVGAGSAGCVLAERLSADPSCEVTLLETGGTVRPEPGWVLPIGADSTVARQHRTTLTQNPARSADIVRGRVLGGSGAINGGYFCRGWAADFDTWAVPGWAWSDVLPHYRAIETDHDFSGAEHGAAGPVPVRRTRDFAASSLAFRDAAGIRYPWIDDLNAESGWRPGLGAVPLNIDDAGHRRGPGEIYLAAARGRGNLTVLTGTRVLRVLFDGGRAVGVRCAGPDGVVDRYADRIVLCAGAIESAHLLMLSGIGPAAQLRAVEVPVLADLPVGVSCGDHPEWVVPTTWPADPGRPPLELLLTTEELEIRPYTCGFAAMTGGATDDADHVHLGISLMRPRSLGQVLLASGDPDVRPVIEHRYDADPADAAALHAGHELCRDLFGDAVVDDAEPAWSTAQHLSATAPMGADGDERAVLDSRCRVRGIEGLWVVDGSALPGITARGPHATIVMLAHRAAQFVVA